MTTREEAFSAAMQDYAKPQGHHTGNSWLFTPRTIKFEAWMNIEDELVFIKAGKRINEGLWTRLPEFDIEKEVA